MRKIIYISSALMIITAFFQKSAAQNQAFEKLNAYRVAFFTNRLNLTTEEAQKFWPIYNELQRKKNAIQVERASIFRNISANELNMNDKEITEAGDRLVSLDLQEANLTSEYHKKFREILSPVKVVRLYQAENQYRIQLLNELRDNQQLRNNLQQRPLRKN